jgi:uncharacterized protein YnzC (UPF0291/DUF896 family)
MAGMKRFHRIVLFLAACLLITLHLTARAQCGGAAAGSIQFVAKIAPTAGRPEPVRQFTFYLLRKSYAEVIREAEGSDPLPTREEYITGLKLSPELKAWMKTNDTVDLAGSDVEAMLKVDNILGIPEFMDAYLNANSGGVTKGLPRPKYTKDEETKKSERYQKLRQEYLAALRKFIQANPQSMGGMQAFLEPINPARKWNQINAEHRHLVERRAPELAQTKYLVATVDSDLDGRAALNGLAAGNYWLGTLNMIAIAGDSRLRWDVPVTVEGGKTSRIELSNLNATDTRLPR